MSAPPRVGLVGAGRWGRNIIATIRRARVLDLAWVASANPATAALVPPGCRVVEDWRAAAAAPDVEGVIVATPAGAHAEIAEAFLKPGVALFVEKPLTPDLDSTLALTRKIRAAGNGLMVDYIHLHHPAFLAMLKSLELIGGYAAIRAAAGNWGPFRPDIGVLWDWGPHDAAMCGLLGDASFSRVEAKRLERRTVEGGIGESIAIAASFRGCPDVRIELSNLRREKTRRLELLGPLGSLVYDGAGADPLLFKPAAGAPEVLPVGAERPLDRALKSFAGVIRGRAGNRDAIEQTVRVARFLDAAGRSLETGRPVAGEATA